MVLRRPKRMMCHETVVTNLSDRMRYCKKKCQPGDRLTHYAIKEVVSSQALGPEQQEHY